MTTNSRRKLLGSILVGFMVAFSVFGVTRVLDTDAAIVDDVFGSGTFDVSEFGIEGSLKPTDGFSDHESVADALAIIGYLNPQPVTFTPPMDIAPGGTSYVPFYVRTKAGSLAADVTMSSAQQVADPKSNTDLWNTYMKYGAVVLDGSATCGASAFTNPAPASVLVPSNSAMGSTVANKTFPLQANSGNVALVCFEFKLLATVTSVATTNGQSIYPYWEFKGQSK